MIGKNQIKISRAMNALIVVSLILSGFFKVYANNPSPIFPIPQEMEVTQADFELTENTLVLVPTNPSPEGLFLARFFIRELCDRYGLALIFQEATELPADRPVVLMGSIQNPLVQAFCRQNNFNISAKQPGPEGYLLRVTDKIALVAGSDAPGAFYGLQSLRQLIKRDGDVKIQGVQVRDWPATSFRGIRLYIPGRENITFFKRFIRDFMALYKFNKVILEVNACMRFDSHPELNAGWIEFAKSLHYTRRSRPAGPHDQFQDSAHHDAGDGMVLEKDEVRDLVEYARAHFIEVIPEIPSLTHTYYLLTRDRELAEIQAAEWPDTYCPANPKSYELLFDVFDEYIEVINPQMIHIGKDEWRMEVNVCLRCKGKDYTELFVNDVNQIYDYLTQKKIRVGMWGDHLLESVRSKGFRDRKSSSGYEYQIPGAITPEQVKNSIPKDILIFNWFWGESSNDRALQKFGFQQVYGNFRPNISQWEQRRQWSGVLGGAPSSWAATTEFNFGKDLLYDFLGCANLLWSSHLLEQKGLAVTVQQLIPSIRGYMRAVPLPSEDGDPVAALDISQYFNAATGEEMLGADLNYLQTGTVGIGPKVFQLGSANENGGKRVILVRTTVTSENDVPNEIRGIQVNEDVSSLIFLHACAKPAGNEKSYRTIYNFDDTADLLGWYEIVYEDGYLETIPVRYGVNILEWNLRRPEKIDNWPEGSTGAQQNFYTYAADAIACSQNMKEQPITFFAFEWKNSRFGRVIKEINLKGTRHYLNYKNKPIDENAIILLAISQVKKREVLKK